MPVGYMRVSKADGSQATDLQRNALLAAGVGADHLYEDAASGKPIPLAEFYEGLTFEDHPVEDNDNDQTPPAA